MTCLRYVLELGEWDVRPVLCVCVFFFSCFAGIGWKYDVVLMFYVPRISGRVDTSLGGYGRFFIPRCGWLYFVEVRCLLQHMGCVYVPCKYSIIIDSGKLILVICARSFSLYYVVCCSSGAASTIK